MSERTAGEEESTMKVYDFSWGPYPRRVTIYRLEKNIPDLEVVDVQLANDRAKGWPEDVRKLSPSGSLPILDPGDGTLVRQSLAILEYLEDRYPTPTMLGETPAERALVRELISVFDDATAFFGLWATKSSNVADVVNEPKSRDISEYGHKRFVRDLEIAEAMMSESGPWLTGESVTTADCVAIATLNMIDEVYSVKVPAERFPKLAGWYERFSARPSVTPLAPLVPPHILSACLGLEEQSGLTLSVEATVAT
jgi:glutathione S-transferase